MKLDRERIVKWLNNVAAHPFASLLQLLVFSAWVMAVLLAWVTIYRQFNVSLSWPFIRSSSSGMELLLSFTPLALLYFIPRR